MFSQKELRRTDNNLLRRIQRQMDSEVKKSPFVDTPERQFLKVLKEELEKDPVIRHKKTKLNLYENNLRNKGR